MKKVKAKVLDFKPMYWGIFCGTAKLEIVETKEIIEIPMVYKHKAGEIIEICENEDSGT